MDGQSMRSWADHLGMRVTPTPRSVILLASIMGSLAADVIIPEPVRYSEPLNPFAWDDALEVWHNVTGGGRYSVKWITRTRAVEYGVPPRSYKHWEITNDMVLVDKRAFKRYRRKYDRACRRSRN